MLLWSTTFLDYICLLVNCITLHKCHSWHGVLGGRVSNIQKKKKQLTHSPVVFKHISLAAYAFHTLFFLLTERFHRSSLLRRMNGNNNSRLKKSSCMLKQLLKVNKLKRILLLLTLIKISHLWGELACSMWCCKSTALNRILVLLVYRF